MDDSQHHQRAGLHAVQLVQYKAAKGSVRTQSDCVYKCACFRYVGITDKGQSLRRTLNIPGRYKSNFELTNRHCY